MRSYLDEIRRYGVLTECEERELALALGDGEKRAAARARLVELNEIRRYGTLTEGEERELALALEDGEKRAAARARLVETHLPLVVAVAKRYRDRGLDFDDLVGEGNVGLLRAVDGFDPAVGVRFVAYAEKVVTTHVISALVWHGAAVRIPLYLSRLRWRWRSAEAGLAASLGRPPTFDEVADHMGLGVATRENLRCGLDAVRPRVPGFDLDAVAAEAGRDEAEAGEAAGQVAAYLRILDDRAREIVTLRYGLGGRDPVPGSEVGRAYGIGGEWVRRILVSSVGLMRASAAYAGPAPAPQPPPLLPEGGCQSHPEGSALLRGSKSKHWSTAAESLP